METVCAASNHRNQKSTSYPGIDNSADLPSRNLASIYLALSNPAQRQMKIKNRAKVLYLLNRDDNLNLNESIATSTVRFSEYYVSQHNVLKFVDSMMKKKSGVTTDIVFILSSQDLSKADDMDKGSQRQCISQAEDTVQSISI